MDHHPTPEEIFLVIEVADTTQERDCGQKAGLYCKANIVDYWVLDVNKKQVYVFRKPIYSCHPERSEGAHQVQSFYQQQIVFQESDEICPLAFPEIKIPIKQLFP